MGFSDYLWELAHGVFKKKIKEKSDVYKTLVTVGATCDQAKKDIFKIREIALIMTAEGTALDYHGKDRTMPRYTNESDDEYRKRLLSAAYYYSLGGTVPGMLAALDKLGYPGSEMYELYKEKYEAVPNPAYTGKWAEFIIKLHTTDIAVLDHNYKIMKAVINKVKRATKKLYAIAFIMQITSSLFLNAELSIGQLIETRARGIPVKLDGSRKLDGAWKLDSKSVVHHLVIKKYVNGIITETSEY